MKLNKVVISGGGTGGHIFPAIAIANEIKRRYPECEILFIGANGKMEMEKVPAAGYRIEGLDIVGIQRKLTLKNFAVPYKLFKSLKRAKKIIKEFNPDVAIGVGGYASAPTLRVSGRMGIPTLLQEQNSYPGVTNKILAKKAKKICVAYPKMDRFFPAEKIIITGNPVRTEVAQIEGKREEAIKEFGLNPNKKTIFILGGSLGARTLNNAVKKAASNWNDKNCQVIWQCGKFYENEMIGFVKEGKHEHLKLNAFIQRMDLAYAAADIVVSRAGALSVSELSLIGKPTVFVPSPNVSEDHQTKNALALVENEAAVLVKDSEAEQRLDSVVIDLLDSPDKLSNLAAKIKSMGLPNATDDIVNEIEKLHTA
jgi:UDP-N-acetylglucosamine--N-acetylmuramyl-(pentapeptide) pyrophosphoryl-undecaprenol N-acetylglucosamine transferase